MLWLDSPWQRADALPAAWLVETAERPATLPERSQLRREMGRAVIGTQLAVDPRTASIGHDGAGRPLVENPAGSGLRLSLATRGGIVAVAIADRAVGVDVELVDPAGGWKLAVLHAQERERLSLIGEAERPAAFARLWAAKEAYVKALGTGFATAPESFAVAFEAGGAFEVKDPARRPAHGVSIVRQCGDGRSVAAALLVLD